MQEMFLGDVIKRRRLELNLTQEQLCQGICEPITISRLENGKHAPSHQRINALLERLDLPTVLRPPQQKGDGYRGAAKEDCRV